MTARNEAARRQLLLSGYFREIELILYQNIPLEVTEIIISFQTMALILGIGDNNRGHLGLGHSDVVHTYTMLEDLQNLAPSIDNIYRNNNSIMVITQNKEIFAAGTNSRSRLGIEGDDEFINFIKLPLVGAIKSASKGAENNQHTFIMTENNEIYGSGSNYSGNLGNGKATRSYDIKFKFDRINTDFIKLEDEYIVDIQCGECWSIFLSNHGLIYSAGRGAIGHELYSISTPTLIDLNNDNVPIIQVTGGYYHALALDMNNRLIVWGNNYYGQVNSEHSFDIKLPIFHKYFKEKDIKIKYINAGYQHSMAIDIDNECYLFGWGNKGQIGNGESGDDKKIYVPFKITDVIKQKIIEGENGDGHTVLLSKSNEVITVGDNTNHQCSVKLQDSMLLKPHILSKSEEIGVLETSVVEKIMALNNGTIIFVNPN